MFGIHTPKRRQQNTEVPKWNPPGTLLMYSYLVTMCCIPLNSQIWKCWILEEFYVIWKKERKERESTFNLYLRQIESDRADLYWKITWGSPSSSHSTEASKAMPLQLYSMQQAFIVYTVCSINTEMNKERYLLLRSVGGLRETNK